MSSNLKVRRVAVLVAIRNTINQLTLGDLERVLRFVEGIKSDRTGKRQQRRSRIAKPEIEDWRIGN